MCQFSFRNLPKMCFGGQLYKNAHTFYYIMTNKEEQARQIAHG